MTCGPDGRWVNHSRILRYARVHFAAELRRRRCYDRALFAACAWPFKLMMKIKGPRGFIFTGWTSEPMVP